MFAPRFVLAPDSFKESMSAQEAAQAMQRGILKALPEAHCILLPLSDGGEGFTEALASSLGAELVQTQVCDALGRKRQATWAFDASQKLAVIESAQACGLAHIEPKLRDIMRSDSRGLGSLIKAALDKGAQSFVIGLGGSATNDWGCGMLQSLGASFYDKDGAQLEPCPQSLAQLARVDFSALDSRLNDVNIQLACDVDNPLLGPKGCAHVFAAQKGASIEQIEQLDAMAYRLAELSNTTETCQLPGCGAAGGLGWAFHLILKAKLSPGIDLVIKTIKLKEALKQADFVFTGEGKIDDQTLHGKTPYGVALAAKEAKIPCLVFAGSIGKDRGELLEYFEALVPIVQSACSLDEALEQAQENLESAAQMASLLLFASRDC